MSEINDGGPAFPVEVGQDGGGVQTGCYSAWATGLSIRDYFAAQALVGMMQAMRPYSDDFERSAKNAYLQADAMLKAREA
jgi:hypothetical protein